MSAGFDKANVSTDNILKAMHEFNSKYPTSNEYDKWLNKGNYKYAVKHDGQYYPVKYLLSEATRTATSAFSGGNRANTILRDLGFQVVSKPSETSV